MVDTKCFQCGAGEMKFQARVLTDIPLYRWRCDSCGQVDCYYKEHHDALFTALLEKDKP